MAMQFPLAQFPISTFDALTHVQRLIREEWRRVNLAQFHTDPEYDYVPKEMVPPCGAIACVGGWLDNILAESPLDMAGSLRLAYFPESFTGPWYEPGSLISRLFSAELHRDEYSTPHRPRQGTREYARAAIRRIERFKQQYKAELKGYVMTGPVKS